MSRATQAFIFGLCLFCVSAISAVGRADIEVVPDVNVSRYLGTWYQIARNPVLFETGCVCSRQVLSLAGDGGVTVDNTCNFLKPNGRVLSIHGTAQSVNAPADSKFEVDFGLPWKGDYWIIALDADYRYAVVTDRHQTSLYVLSKTPTLSSDLYSQALADASTQVNTSKLKLTRQEDCRYP